jgi:hypothetical protein
MWLVATFVVTYVAAPFGLVRKDVARAREGEKQIEFEALKAPAC